MFGKFDLNVIERSWVYLFQTGMTFTLELTALAMTGGIVLGTLLTTGIAVMLWQRASERLEARALNHGFMLGRTNERRELAIELGQMDWQADVRPPRAVEAWRCATFPRAWRERRPRCAAGGRAPARAGARAGRA